LRIRPVRTQTATPFRPRANAIAANVAGPYRSSPQTVGQRLIPVRSFLSFVTSAQLMRMSSADSRTRSCRPSFWAGLYINLLSRPHRAVGARSVRVAQVPRCPLRPHLYRGCRLGYLRTHRFRR